MKLTVRLETLILMGVKAAGSYDESKALGFVEEQMTPREFTVAVKFLKWIVANKLTFDRRNIRERFQQFKTAE